METQRRPGFTLAAFAVAFAAVVVILGAWTRLEDAGLGCPDWPGCYGFLGVPQAEEDIAQAERLFPDAPFEADKAWPEMIHRYFAGSLGVLIIAILALALRHRQLPGQPLKLPLALLGMVMLQGAFGAWTVTLKLWPQVVTAHLLGGFTTLTLLWVLALRLGWRWLPAPPAFRGAAAALRPWALALLVAVIGQIALGGWVSSNYAALACPDFPTCQGAWVPEADFAHGFDFTQEVGPNYLGGALYGEGRVAIHFVHRLGALFVAALGLFMILRLLKAPKDLGVQGWGRALGAVLALQISLGIGNVVLGLPLAVATAHNAVGAALLLVTVAVNYRLHTATRASAS
ncbi:MAG: COX15/CtaA family protein [Pseudomonadales bacterium]|jgi:cytochrome c oxidase assembly protein subunit 15|nr:COX15/CtaA family protein [Pseudomonadales bacterium]MBL6808108.1 COX15/CtaA family protein [Pseudomonadales bacterium]MDA0954880.1 COX15/CtaA family protein [Pseudomonadota bacterium]